ncbi:hypothetical protein [Algoriphagus aquimarinus]|uniref:hypothetical protein n=1 Tax=Algoriphagus aquimarinus TaxID=237018 RepID=UPI0030D6FC52|tara:strand:- start:48751 stop:49275 length:525 start_codon:yes stop_codon:yes gene_type:complete
MNTETYDYVQKIAKSIKNKSDVEDVAQEVLLILLEKNLLDKELTEGLQNYIKGIVWNYSTTLYNDFRKDTFQITSTVDNIPEYTVSTTYLSDSQQYKETLRTIKDYVFRIYYRKGKAITKWRVFYLQLINNDYKYVSKRLGLTYKTCIEYNYQALKEIKSELGTRIIDTLSKMK